MGFTSEQFEKMGLKKNPDGTYSKAKTVPQPREKVQVMTPEVDLIVGESVKTRLVFKWADKHISLNEWYSSKHWTQRNKAAKIWHEFFKSYLTLPLPKFNKYDITLEFNSRLDPSNTITMIKLVEDMMQEVGIIKNDNKDCCLGIHIIPVLDMKKFSYKLIINGE